MNSLWIARHNASFFVQIVSFGKSVQIAYYFEVKDVFGRSGMKKLKIRQGILEFKTWLWHLFSQPVFIFVTIWGHFCIFFGALAFYYLESAVNVKLPTFLHSYYWAISTATTVGSDIVPVTDSGRLVAIFMMVSGSLFLWSYTALFAASLVSSDMQRVGRDVEEMESELKEEIESDKISYKNLAKELAEIKALLEKRK